MKGLLLKEFYLWLKTRSILILLMVLFVLSNYPNGNLGLYIVFLSLISVIIDFSEEEKHGFGNFKHIWPCSSFQIIASKYIVHSVEMLFSFAAAVLSSSISFKKLDVGHSVISVEYMTKPFLITVGLFETFSITFVALALSLFIFHSFSGKVRYFLSLVLHSLTFIIMNLLSYDICVPFTNSTFYPTLSFGARMFYYNKWLFVCVAAVSLITMLISFISSVYMFSPNKNHSLIKLKTVTVVMSAVTVLLVLLSLCRLYYAGALNDIKKDESELFEKNFEEILNNSELEIDRSVETEEMRESKEEMSFLIKNFCNRNFLSKPLSECTEYLRTIGFKKTNVQPITFKRSSFENGTEVCILKNNDSDSVKKIEITAECVETYLETATTEKMEEICSEFTIGLSEKELLEKFEKYELCADFISEYYSDGKPRRRYSAKFYIESYNNADPVVYAIHAELEDGKTIGFGFYENQT